MKIQLQNSKGHPVGTCEHEGIKLDIGCGMGRRRDCIGIDISPTEQTDIVRDFETQGLPFCDRSVERIYAYNMLEHIGEGFHFLMMEMWRVLKDDGVLELIVPNGGHEVDFGDPTHKRHFNKRTFAYFTKSKPKYHSYLDDHKWIIDKLEIKKDEEGRDELILRGDATGPLTRRRMIGNIIKRLEELLFLIPLNDMKEGEHSPTIKLNRLNAAVREVRGWLARLAFLIVFMVLVDLITSLIILLIVIL